MKNELRKNKLIFITVLFALTTLLSCANNREKIAAANSEIDSLRMQSKNLTANNEMIEKNLMTFDTFDFTVFSNQAWTRLHESHADNLKLNWPGGRLTSGIVRHISDLKSKFIHPTGKSFLLPMCTVGIWKDGVMIEEYLYWDNQSYMNQIGMGKLINN
jgi:hypothetical protein